MILVYFIMHIADKFKIFLYNTKAFYSQFLIQVLTVCFSSILLKIVMKCDEIAKNNMTFYLHQFLLLFLNKCLYELLICIK